MTLARTALMMPRSNQIPPDRVSQRRHASRFGESPVCGPFEDTASERRQLLSASQSEGNPAGGKVPRAKESDSFECNRGAHQTQRSKPQMGSFFGNPTSPYLVYYKRLTCYHPQKMHNPIPPCFPHIFAQPKGSQLLRGVFDARRLTWNTQNQRCKALSLNGLRRPFDFVKKNTNLRFRSVDTPLRLR
jgi:hypothetical protein